MYKTTNSDVRLCTGGLPTRFCPINMHRRACCPGFTIVEILIAIAIIATLVGIAIPVSSHFIDQARIGRAIAEIRLLEKDITTFELENGAFPSSLNDVGRGTLLDPWRNPYEYLNIAAGGVPKGQMRKDRFLVPVNSDYDLYSMGKDGDSKAPFTAKASRDDIVRCNDGGYVGLASEF